MFNGKPVFSVGLSDFNTICHAKVNGGRIFVKSIINDELREFYKNNGGGSFVVEYNGVFIEV